MILADDLDGRKRALDKILPMQKSDFLGIFREMKGLPVTIRLLDPPLHEFLPQTDDDVSELAQSVGIRFSEVKDHVDHLHEFNPMLGHRAAAWPLLILKFTICRFALLWKQRANWLRMKGMRLFLKL